MTCKPCIAQTIAHRLVPVGDAGRGAVEQVRAMVAVHPVGLNCPAPQFLHGLLARWVPWQHCGGSCRAGWQARLQTLSDTLELTQRNVYILPTGAGWMLALTLLVLLLASINFQLNLGYLFTFLLAGSAVIGMHISHATLRGLTLHLKQPEPQFMGQGAALTVQLANERRSPRVPSPWPCTAVGTGPGPTCPRRATPRCRSPSPPRSAACTPSPC
jgi:hypothetical protein